MLNFEEEGKANPIAGLAIQPSTGFVPATGGSASGTADNSGRFGQEAG